ncbi:hypothetical protein Peur_045263 [Populus x canadensis]
MDLVMLRDLIGLLQSLKLQGKAPNQASLGEEGIDLPRWVKSVVREEWAAEVLAVELMRYHNIEEEMVVRMIEDMNRGYQGDGLRQSSNDPSKGSDGHTPPSESKTPPGVVTP